MQNKSIDTHRYDDIIDLPRPVSPRHPPMSNADRAAQFAPFAALTGHDAALRESARLTQAPTELTEERKEELDRLLHTLLAFPCPPLVTITHFLPDNKKAGGAYIRTTSRITRLDTATNTLVLCDDQHIPLAAVYDIQVD